MSDKVLAAVRSISPRGPIRYIVNTYERDEFTGGNEKLALAGNTIRFRIATDLARVRRRSRRTARRHLVRHGVSADVGAHGQVAPRSEDAWPDDTYSSTQKKLYFNDEPVLIMHVPVEHRRQQHRPLPASMTSSASAI